jgi:predicted naringenin-chalcone synthase
VLAVAKDHPDPIAGLGPARIRALATAVPGRRWSQRETYDYVAERAPSYRRKAIERVFANAGIDHRHLAMVPETLDPAPPSDVLHAGFEEHAPALALKAARAALTQAGLGPEDIDGLVIASSTGYLCPGLAARCAPELGLSANAMRTEIVGAGCAGALPALQRGYDFVRAHPEKRVLVVCVEICSACPYVDDDLETAVGLAICADGAAAVILEGDGCASSGEGRDGTSVRLPQIAAFETAADPDYLDSVGFARRDGRLRIVLSKRIPEIAAGPVRETVGRALAQAGLAAGDVDHWVVHSGGRRVLDRLSDDLDLAPEALAASRRVLAERGNMSSPTALFVLAETLASRNPQPGDVGVLVALGPGLVAECALLLW